MIKLLNRYKILLIFYLLNQRKNNHFLKHQFVVFFVTFETYLEISRTKLKEFDIFSISKHSDFSDICNVLPLYKQDVKKAIYSYFQRNYACKKLHCCVKNMGKPSNIYSWQQNSRSCTCCSSWFFLWLNCQFLLPHACYK